MSRKGGVKVSVLRFLLFLIIRVMKLIIYKRIKRVRNYMYGLVGCLWYVIVLKEEKIKYVGVRMVIVVEVIFGDGERIILILKIVEVMFGFCESRYVGWMVKWI